MFLTTTGHHLHFHLGLASLSSSLLSPRLVYTTRPRPRPRLLPRHPLVVTHARTHSPSLCASFPSSLLHSFLFIIPAADSFFNPSPFSVFDCNVHPIPDLTVMYICIMCMCTCASRETVRFTAACIVCLRVAFAASLKRIEYALFFSEFLLVPHGFSMICNSMNESFSFSLGIYESSAFCPLFLCPPPPDSLLLCPLRNKFFTLYFSVNSLRRFNPMF